MGLGLLVGQGTSVGWETSALTFLVYSPFPDSHGPVLADLILPRVVQGWSMCSWMLGVQFTYGFYPGFPWQAGEEGDEGLNNPILGTETEGKAGSPRE